MISKTKTGRLLAALLLCATGATARELPLAQPVDCVLGQTCYLQNLVDHDPGPDASDHQCGDLTYDGHKGTDFALPSLAAMEAGVDVLAAAPGTVRAVRDEMPDRRFDQPGGPDVDGRECGNGIVITHGDGWETQYCHLKQGSVQVAPGDWVAVGTVLGQIGLSGRSQFPHLHLSVRKDGAVVDPFDPDGQITCGAADEAPLWTTPVTAPPGGLIGIGFAEAVPEFDSIKAGTAARSTLPATAPALVLWTFVFGGQAGDEIALAITGPDGTVFEATQTLTRTQAQLFRAGGRKTPEGGWPEGTYQGTAIHLRDGIELDRMTTTITLQ